MSWPLPLDVLAQISNLIWALQHPKAEVVVLLNASVGLLLKVWFGFILNTTDFETGRDFITNATISRYEPALQIVADASLALIAMWASFRIMWGHGIRSQYTARILLPRLLMGGVLINFALPLFQMVVDASNTFSHGVMTFIVFDDPSRWWAGFAKDPTTGFWDVLTVGLLSAGYDALAISYVVRYAILIVLAITAPIAGLLFILPETHHISKQWVTHFTTNLFMQPAQLFVLAVGFALERDGGSPIHHLFALATLFIVFKVPGALGGADKAAHKLESTVASAFHHLERGLLKA
jgi:hypothetical protein